MNNMHRIFTDSYRDYQKRLISEKETELFTILPQEEYGELIDKLTELAQHEPLPMDYYYRALFAAKDMILTGLSAKETVCALTSEVAKCYRIGAAAEMYSMAMKLKSAQSVMSTLEKEGGHR